MTLNTVTVTWDELDIGQAALAGTITFQLNAPLGDATDGLTVNAQPPRSYRFSSGTGSSDPLVANDNTNLPAGSYYTITVSIAGQQPYSFAAKINHANGATQTAGYLLQNQLQPVSQFGAYMPLPSGTPAAYQVPSVTASGSTATRWAAALFAGPATYFMPAPSGGDDTAAFQAALAALPTVTIYANPNTQTGTSAAVPAGTVFLAPGTYQVGAAADIGNLGPMVNMLGPGRNAATIAYYGAGDCLRVYNPVRPASDTFDDLAAFQGVLDGFTIDGTNAQAGASGLHYGDTEGGTLGPGLMIVNFSQGALSGPPVLTLGSTTGSGGTFAPGTYFWTVTALSRTGETVGSNQVHATIAANGTQALSWTAVTGAAGYRVYRGSGTAGTPNTYVAAPGAVTSYTDTGTSVYKSCPPQVATSGNTGLWFDNTVAWTENIYGRVVVRNCANAVVFDGAGGVTDVSFEYNDLTFKIYAMQNQNGVILRGGAYYHNGSLKVRANFADGPTAMSSASLALVGAYNGAYTGISNSRLDVQAEINTPLTGGGSNGPRTISLSDPDQNQIAGCTGVLSWLAFAVAWTVSNWSSGVLKANFSFDGVVQGDTTLSVASAPNPTGVGGRTFSAGLTQTGGWMPLVSGDTFALTLTGSVTLQHASSQAPGIGGAQRKTIFITQAASGGPYTVTWPKPGSPSLTSPAVYWPGGVAPTQSTGASAIDKYVLETLDGVHWYGTQSQAFS